MAKLVSPVTIARAAHGAGFRGGDLTRMVAIALAESSGNAEAVNPRSGALGLWQILPSAHPWITGQNWRDPNVNAAAAYRVYSEPPSAGKITTNKWAVWPLAAAAYMPVAVSAVAAAKLPKGVGEAVGPNPLLPGLIDAGQSEELLNPISAAIPENPLEAARGVLNALQDQAFWLRAAKVAAGAALVIAGVVIVGRGAVADTAGRAVGAAVKGATK